MGDKDKERGRNDLPPERKKSSIVRNLFYLALLVMVAVGFLAFLSFDPQDLSDIKGYRAEPEVIRPAPPDIPGLLKGVSTSDDAVRISEQQLNLYLRGTLRFTQEGMMNDYFEARGVWVRLHEGEAEVILEREIKGQRRHTISMFLRPVQKEDSDGVLHTSMQPRKGRWGRTQVWNGFLLLTKSSFVSLGQAYSKELQLLERLFESKVVITITEEYIELQPQK